MDKLKNALAKFADAFQNNKYTKTISQAMMGLMPLIMVSSVAALVSAIDIGPSQEILRNACIIKVCNIINSMTLEVISIYVAFLVAYKLGEGMKKDALNCGVIGVMAFLILCPLTDGSSKIELSSLGSSGMFTGIFGSLIAARLYIFFIDRKLVIRMPEAVPPVVAKSFAAIIPGLLVAIIFSVITVIMSLTPWGTVTNMLMVFIQKPLMALGSNIITCMILVALIELLWFFGMHGVMAIMPILMILFLEPQIANQTAYAQGNPLPYMITLGFILGNRGARSMAVSLLCIFRCKSARLKAVGKAGFIPALFGISEPIKFGIPQVMNIRMLIPLMLTPAVSVLSAWLLTVIGFMPYHNGVQLPTAFPIIINGFFTNGWQGIIAQIVQLLLCVLIYIPFIRLEDKMAYKEESENMKTEVA